MTQPETNSPKARKDSLIGVCQAIGTDLGFNPDYLRIVFAVMIIANPVATLGAYAALGVIVLASRLLTYKRRPSAPTPLTQSVEPKDHANAPALELQAA